MAKVEAKSLENSFEGNKVYTQFLKVKDVLSICYVAVRNVSEEEGAVQRVLNVKRVDEIKKFVLDGNMFFNTFLLNWTQSNEKPEFSGGKIHIPVLAKAAQVLDGQHRLAGLEEAMIEKNEIGEEHILVSICLNLMTKQSAKIFLNINSEQKPVPKSLIYDLFGEVEDNQDHAINRAMDIAQELNENTESPYHNKIKFPGENIGSIDLSTVVGCLKKYLEKNGNFEAYNVSSINTQKQVILNYFNAIKFYYENEKLWEIKTKNPFLKSAGFAGAIDFFVSEMLGRCAELKSFKIETIKNILSLEKNRLILQEDIKALDGKTARRNIEQYLLGSIKKALPSEKEYEV